MIARTLAARFQLVVLLGALLPMALVGLWLTRANAGAGRQLLRDQLQSAATSVRMEIEQTWSTRDGELRLLANNSAAVSMLRGGAVDVADTAYLRRLASSLGENLVGVSYRDRSDRVRWQFEPRNTNRSAVAQRPASGVRIEQSMPIDRAVVADGDTLGVMHASLRMAGLLPADASIRRSAGTAALVVADSQGVLWSELPDSVGSVALQSTEWEAVVDSVPQAGIRLQLVAPTAPYVTPFRDAARAGSITLLLAALAGLVATGMMARTLTRSIHELADAATDVSAGQLHRSVAVRGSDEVMRLSGAFNRMTASLRDSLGELSRQRSLAAVGEFASGLSHDVRNSLTAVRVDLQHAGKHLDASHASTPLVLRALDSVRRLDATVSSALRVARPGEAALLPIAHPVERAISAASPSFSGRGALLDCDAIDTSIQVRGNDGALEQVFLSLLINAAEALAPGERAIVVVAAQDDDVVVIVRDEGVGIAAHHLDSIGTPLFTTKKDGTGLGLSLARRIADAHGGSLDVTSTWGEGTTVTVRLPRGR